MTIEQIEAAAPPEKGKLKPYYKDILKMYFIDRVRTEEIARRVDCTPNGIIKFIRRYGKPFSVSEGSRKYHFDMHILDNIDEQWKAYFLGWMFSDGNVYKRALKNTVSLCIVEDDIAILNYFNKKFFPNVDRPLNKRPSKLKKGTEFLCRPLTRFQIDSIYLSDKLIEHGVIPVKSKAIRFPQTIPKQLMSHFIRGLFEGDGCVTTNNTHWLTVMILSASNSFLEDVKKFLDDELDIVFTIAKNSDTNSKVGSIKIRKNEYIKKFFNYIYKDSEMYLERKKIKFKMEEPILLHNSIKTPDGTVLVSHHTHDFVCHEDSVTGTRYCIDGGIGGYRRILPGGVYVDLSVYSDDPFEKIRESLERVHRGKNLDQPARFVVLKDMSDAWLDALIIWIEANQPNNSLKEYYLKEIEYRKENNIKVEEDED